MLSQIFHPSLFLWNWPVDSPAIRSTTLIWEWFGSIRTHFTNVTFTLGLDSPILFNALFEDIVTYLLIIATLISRKTYIHHRKNGFISKCENFSQQCWNIAMLEMVVLPLCHSFPASRFPLFSASTHLVFWYLRREPENKRKLFRPWEVNDTWRNSPEICHKENTGGSKFGRRLFDTYICSLYLKVLMFRITYKAMSHVRCTSWIMAH